MPRQVRIEYDGAVYHLMERGNRRGEIFLGDGDRERFLKNLGKACGMTGREVLKYLLDLDVDQMLAPNFSKEYLSRSAKTGVLL